MKNIIEAIEKELQAQKDEIFFKNVQIEDLKRQLAEASKELEELKAKKQTRKGFADVK